MKTPERALIEWVNDEILFDYSDEKGPKTHNRDQFIKMCELFTIYIPTEESESEVGQYTHGSGTIRSGVIGHMNIGTGMLSTGSVVQSTASIGAVPRDDISTLTNFNVTSRIRDVALSCIDLMKKTLHGRVDRAVMSRVRSLLEPRNVAQFETAKELIKHLVEFGLKNEIS